MKHRGFTLAEMLIVVAMIAALVAVSVPTFSNYLEKTRQSADVSNLRGAYALAKLSELDGEVLAYYADEEDDADNEARPVKIGLPSAWNNTLAATYSGIGYAFWYDADSGRLYLDTRFSDEYANNDSLAAAVGTIKTVNEDNAETDENPAKTRLSAHSTKVRADLSGLPDGGIIQYHADSNTPANGDLPGDTDVSWANRKILVVFFNDSGRWHLKASSIRFANASNSAAQLPANSTTPYPGNLSVPVEALVK